MFGVGAREILAAVLVLVILLSTKRVLEIGRGAGGPFERFRRALSDRSAHLQTDDHAADEAWRASGTKRLSARVQ